MVKITNPLNSTCINEIAYKGGCTYLMFKDGRKYYLYNTGLWNFIKFIVIMYTKHWADLRRKSAGRAFWYARDKCLGKAILKFDKNIGPTEGQFAPGFSKIVPQ